MKSTYLTFLFITALLTCNSVAKAQTNLKDLKGLWKCYSNLQDTLKGCRDCFWMAFDETTMQTLLSSGVSTPEPAGEKTYYEFKNNVLKTQQGKKTLKLKITVYHPNFISYAIPMNGKSETVYLKRETKSR
jgi:hypothetical protein